MCGIAGWYQLEGKMGNEKPKLEAALNKLKKRGPDHTGIYTDDRVMLGHNRLSIIDISEAGNQPMFDPTGRYAIVFNGEIFNYRELQPLVTQKGVQLKSTSDTEVLLHLLIHYGTETFNKLNGFWALAFYDKQTGNMILARDRYGVKPLLYYYDWNKFLFASELKGLVEFGFSRKIDNTAIYQYFQLNYLAPNRSIMQGVYKLTAGSYLTIQNGKVSDPVRYYKIQRQNWSDYAVSEKDYKAKQEKLVELMDAAVARRLISDVPIGVFLSGGIDSSVIAALASRHTKNLNTFSIGFDDPLFDETHYAQMVADRYQTNHTVFRLKYDEMAGHLFDILDYFDEPFADPSAINFYILSQYTRPHATVVLSGDGADELFAGYSKHIGEFRARQQTPLNLALSIPGVSKLAASLLPANRDTERGRKLWQYKKYIKGMGMVPSMRYWEWCHVIEDAEIDKLIKNIPALRHLSAQEYIQLVKLNVDFNSVLYADMHLVLQGDMLTKVDLMSMANSLEVRTPFLDYTIVNYAFTLPTAYKIDKDRRKKILQDAFRPMLPEQLYNRPKQGFEVPLRNWFMNALRDYIETEVMDENYIRQQGIFNFPGIKALWENVQRSNTGKEDWTMWAFIVFQSCYKKYFS